MKLWHQLFHPEVFQGTKKRTHYFEGWYFKHLSVDGKIIVFIPGVSYEDKKKSAFIQVLIGPPLKTYYIPFSINAFSWTQNPFSIKIGPNVFGEDGVTVSIDHEDLKIEGNILYHKWTGLRRTLLQPNVMGFFAYLTFLECYHGLLSLDHQLQGNLMCNGQKQSFDHGQGYIEKDWGTSFPKRYIWIQCNDFGPSKAGLMCSVAHIPFRKRDFTGFIVVLLVGKKEYRFATYNGSKLIHHQNRKHEVVLLFKKNRNFLEIRGKKTESGALKAPKIGFMKDEIQEILDGEITVRLYHNKKLLFAGNGKHASIEIVGYPIHKGSQVR